MEPYEKLEHELAKWPGTGGLYSPEQVVVCSSGTAALHLALEAMGLPQGSGIVVPDYTMVACARAATLAGLTPRFVDCDERLLMTTDLTRRYGIDGPTSAVMFVHVYGRRVDLTDWGRPGACMTVRTIEDMAEAHGVHPHPNTDAACHSFYRNKIVAGEEGGAVAFKDVAHARVARELRSLGFTREHNFVHRPRGHNYRMSNLHASHILEGYGEGNRNGIPSYRVNVEQRREIESWYDEACPAEWKMPPRDAPWVYDLRIPGLRRVGMQRIVTELNEAGVGARCGFCPMTLQPEYRKANGYTASGMNCLRAFDEVFYLPLTPGEVTRESVSRAFEIIRRGVE